MDIKKYSLLGLLVAASLIPVSSQAAGTTTGTLGVTLTIAEGCSVNNGSPTAGQNQWGSLNFGTYSDLNTIINGTVQSTVGGNVQIICTTGLTPSISLNAGANAQAGGERALVATGVTGATPIPYRLFADPGHSKEYVANTPQVLPIITTADTAQNIPIYGLITPSEQTNKTPAAGTYNDTVTATLSW